MTNLEHADGEALDLKARVQRLIDNGDAVLDYVDGQLNNAAQWAFVHANGLQKDLHREESLDFGTIDYLARLVSRYIKEKDTKQYSHSITETITLLSQWLHFARKEWGVHNMDRLEYTTVSGHWTPRYDSAVGQVFEAPAYLLPNGDRPRCQFATIGPGKNRFPSQMILSGFGDEENPFMLHIIVQELFNESDNDFYKRVTNNRTIRGFFRDEEKTILRIVHPAVSKQLEYERVYGSSGWWWLGWIPGDGEVSMNYPDLPLAFRPRLHLAEFFLPIQSKE
jgi:hypothetical protein